LIPLQGISTGGGKKEEKRIDRRVRLRDTGSGANGPDARVGLAGDRTKSVKKMRHGGDYRAADAPMTKGFRNDEKPAPYKGNGFLG